MPLCRCSSRGALTASLAADAARVRSQDLAAVTHPRGEMMFAQGAVQVKFKRWVHFRLAFTNALPRLSLALASRTRYYYKLPTERSPALTLSTPVGLHCVTEVSKWMMAMPSR